MSTPRPELPRWVFGETEMTEAPRTEMEWKMCTCNQMEGRKTCPIHPPEIAEPTPSPEPINYANQLMGVLNDLYGHTFDILGEQAIVHALKAYADAISKPRLELQAKYYKTLKLLGEARERISELDKELAEEKRRSNALLNLGREIKEGN